MGSQGKFKMKKEDFEKAKTITEKISQLEDGIKKIDFLFITPYRTKVRIDTTREDNRSNTLPLEELYFSDKERDLILFNLRDIIRGKLDDASKELADL